VSKPVCADCSGSRLRPKAGRPPVARRTRHLVHGEDAQPAIRLPVILTCRSRDPFHCEASSRWQPRHNANTPLRRDRSPARPRACSSRGQFEPADPKSAKRTRGRMSTMGRAALARRAVAPAPQSRRLSAQQNEPERAGSCTERRSNGQRTLPPNGARESGWRSSSKRDEDERRRCEQNSRTRTRSRRDLISAMLHFDLKFVAWILSGMPWTIAPWPRRAAQRALAPDPCPGASGRKSSVIRWRARSAWSRRDDAGW